MSRLFRVATVRAIEARAAAALPAGELMSRAADALVAAVAARLASLPSGTPVVALIGPGNNGGDALLAALRLRARGLAVRACSLSAAAPPPAADAARVHAQADAAGLALEPIDRLLHGGGVETPMLIDGLFGIGLARALPKPAIAIVRAARERRWPVIAVDVPSGLDADTGGVVGGSDGDAFDAALTVTMIGDKPGLHTGPGRGHAGRVEVATLGLDLPDGDAELCSRASFGGATLVRGADTHKGSYGDTLIIGGASGMAGAALLAARGAQAAGSGRVVVASPDAPPFDPARPELMTRVIARARPALGAADAIAVGCGLGTGSRAAALLRLAIAHPATLVVDADALNLIARDAELGAALAARSARSILTPHPLEAARLLGSDAAAVQRDRIGAALSLAARFRSVVALKGAGTVVAAPGGHWSINGSGGPVLATAGTGDVLAGLIAGLCAAGRDADSAARLGVWVHGAAGDAIAAARGPIGMPASELPDAIRDCLNGLLLGV